MKKFKVLESHLGDKNDPYEIGDIREADENEVKHLVDAGLLEDAEAGDKKPAAKKAD